MKRLTAAKIARKMWEGSGEPDGRGLGEANLRSYRHNAEDVLAAIKCLGFKLVPYAKRRATTRR